MSQVLDEDLKLRDGEFAVELRDDFLIHSVQWDLELKESELLICVRQVDEC